MSPLPIVQELYCPTRTCDLQTMVLIIMKDFLTIMPIIAVLFIMIGAFKMIVSQGNEEALISAKRTITWAILGLVVAILSFSIIAIVQSLLGATV